MERDLWVRDPARGAGWETASQIFKQMCRRMHNLSRHQGRCSGLAGCSAAAWAWASNAEPGAAAGVAAAVGAVVGKTS